MKKQLTTLLLGLTASALVCVAQDEKPPAPVPESPAPALPEPAVPTPAEPVTPVTPGTPVTPATTPATVPPEPVTPASLPINAREAGNNALPSTPAAAPADKPAGGVVPDAATPAPKPDEPVPLIVIDDVPLTDAIRNLARQSNLNFQFDPKIGASNQPNVSIRFENVSAAEALAAVLDNYNLSIVRDSKSKIARITVKDPKAEEPLISKIVQLKYSDPSNLVSIVKQTLSLRSAVIADPRTANLIISTTEKEMDAAVSLITKLDLPTKQVLIEARLLETSHSPSTVKGIDWSGTFENQHVVAGNNVVNGLVSPNSRVLLDTAKGFNPATAFLDADGLSAVLSFFNKDAESEVVATPRAVMLDNQTATLSVTRAFPIFQVTPGSANSPAGASIQYTNLGTILTVTPRIASDGNVTLRVIPEVSNIDSKDSQVLNGTVNTANIYAIRRMDTLVTIPSGNTLVMGGLVGDTKTRGYSKVPLLGDIPLVGKALFSKESKARNKNNLIIFITPTIVDESDYQPTPSGREFMQTTLIERPDPKERALDSAKPYDWSKPTD
ncbi:MAG: ral secretion pathway protein [Verrucomicrobiota bacterium]|jgi:type II secretory pathway component GspD/PulD (secretin)